MREETNLKLRNQLVQHLKGGNAFGTIERVLKKIPFDKLGVIPDRLPYSFYQQMYHIRFAQLDILDYCRNQDYTAPNWPDDYWPEETAPENKDAWDLLIRNYIDERNEFCEMILDNSNDLIQPFESNSDHNLLREAQLVIEHNAYHTGQLYILFRLINKDSC